MGNGVSLILIKQNYVWVQGCRSGGDIPLTLNSEAKGFKHLTTTLIPQEAE